MLPNSHCVTEKSTSKVSIPTSSKKCFFHDWAHCNLRTPCLHSSLLSLNTENDGEGKFQTAGPQGTGFSSHQTRPVHSYWFRPDISFWFKSCPKIKYLCFHLQIWEVGGGEIFSAFRKLLFLKKQDCLIISKCVICMKIAQFEKLRVHMKQIEKIIWHAGSGMNSRCREQHEEYL